MTQTASRQVPVPRVSLVLPVANQADHLARVVREYLEAATGINCALDLVLAVNSSHDDSLGVATHLARSHPGAVSVVTTESGWGRAVVGGLHHAGGDYVGFANCARTHAPDLTRALRYAVADPGCLVKGTRDRQGYSIIRRLGSILFNAECRVFFGLAARDVNGNPKIWHRSLLDPTLLAEPGSLLDAEVLWLAARRRIPIVESPVVCTARHGGTSMTTLGLAVTMYLRAMVRWSGVPPTRPATAGRLLDA